MRMLYTMGSALLLTLGLRIVDPPVASAVPPQPAVQPAGRLVLSVPRAGSHRADLAAARKSWRP